MCSAGEQKSWRHTSQSACYQLLCPKTNKDRKRQIIFLKHKLIVHFQLPDYKGYFKLRQYFLHCPNCMLYEFL